MTYRFETDMRQDAVAWLMTQPGVDVVFDEVEGYGGYPDLIGACSDTGTLTRRVEGFPPPVCREFDVECLELLQGEATEAELRAHFDPYWKARRDTNVRRLVKLGWLRCDREPMGRVDDERMWWATQGFADPFTQLIAVNLKLRDWRSCGWQAVRASSYLEASYLAIPYSRTTPACVAFVQDVNVGLLGVKPSGAEVIVAPRPRPFHDRLRRRTMSERLLAELRLPALSTRAAGSAGGAGPRAWAQDRLAVASIVPM